MRHLALIAMALMLCMPVLSRWQAQTSPAEPLEMCLSEESRLALDGHAHHSVHTPEDNIPAPHEHAHGHDACGYCTLATRMLPVLALALVLPVPPPIQHSSQPILPAPAASPDWPAHSPRGPPLHA